ncbi:hypothetical protein SDC9_208630 [bioreactor metagenome]|uniref:Uncharacterized protein n=1 Tax=bioreactor metagenome TaxID=1076179 RepID=A0A645JC35_9ZZZZ
MIQTLFKTDTADSSLGPDEVKFLALKRQIFHRTDNPFYPVLETEFPGRRVEFID